jgi:hypothetical protein
MIRLGKLVPSALSKRNLKFERVTIDKLIADSFTKPKE